MDNSFSRGGVRLFRPLQKEVDERVEGSLYPATVVRGLPAQLMLSSLLGPRSAQDALKPSSRSPRSPPRQNTAEWLCVDRAMATIASSRHAASINGPTGIIGDERAAFYCVAALEAVHS